MLIRFVLNNFLSFGQEREFNMLPYERYGKLLHHKYDLGGVEVLKLAAIYGANAAGKSNLIKGLGFLYEMIQLEQIPINIHGWTFELNDDLDSQPFSIAIEFKTENHTFVYAVKLRNGTIEVEELYESGLGKVNDQLIYERTTRAEGHSINFKESFYGSEKNKLLQELLEKSLLRKNKPALKFLSTLGVNELSEINEAVHWFEHTLHIVTPEQPARALAYFFDRDENLLLFANDVMKSYDLGVDGVYVAKSGLEDFFAQDETGKVSEIKDHLSKAGTGVVTMSDSSGNEYTFIEEERGSISVHQLQIEHSSATQKSKLFSLDQESDGSKRLAHFAPVFYDIINKPVVYIIDEIERSLHPSLTKALIHKFGQDAHTMGQLIFTTHDSNLLDQSILRRDEIWFAEKDQSGQTDLYSLSKFREHHTIDIQRGYLNGRYGGIPFTGNLEALNWHEYDPAT